MDRRQRIAIMEWLWPLFAFVGSISRTFEKAFFSRWLQPWFQRRANRALLNDLQRDLYSLISTADLVESPSGNLPFDYASVEILWENLCLTISRGRGAVNVSLAPRHARNERVELGPVIAALEKRHFSSQDVVHDLTDVGSLLRPRLDLLNAAFSEQEYRRTRERM